MSKKDYMEQDLLGEMERLEQKFLPGKTKKNVKDCLGDAIDLIREFGDQDLDLGFFDELERSVTEALFSCEPVKNLPGSKQTLLKDELEVIFKALDYKYAWAEGEKAMAAKPEVFDEAEACEPIEPWWDDDKA